MQNIQSVYSSSQYHESSKAIDDFLSLCSAAQKAFDSLRVYEEEVSGEVTSAIESTGKLVALVAQGTLVNLSREIQPLKKEEISDDFKKKIVLFDIKINELKINLIKIIPHKLFANQTWKTIKFLSTSITACTCHANVNRIARVSFAYGLKDNFAMENNKTSLTIGSMGSGPCLQELYIQAILSKTGKTLNWVLVEPKLKDPSSSVYKATQEFKNIVQFLSPQSTVELYGEGIQDYVAKIESGAINNLPDIFIGVDLKPEIIASQISQVKSTLEKFKNPNNPRLLAIMTPDQSATYTTI